jgi:hypothetical protein
MMNLKFLIQKEGDREWLPLESPTVEVLEGRYHLMARTTQLDQPVDIQIRHRYEENGVLQEERQQRRQQPDTHGNLSLLPNSYLGNGLWTVTCTLCAAQTNRLNQSINLQVLTEDYGFISDWEFVEATGDSWLPAREIAASEMSAIADQINAEAYVMASNKPEMGGETVADVNQSSVVELDETSNRQNLGVSLPVLPQRGRSIPCQQSQRPAVQSQGSPLPPQLAAHRPAERRTQPLDLPTFPREVHWRYIPLNRLLVGMYRRELMQKTHHSDIEQAFMALELQKRFWRAMQQLVDPTAAPADSDAVFTRTAG